MELTASEIALLTGGRLEGDAMARISELSKIQDSHVHSLTFFANPRYLHYISVTKAAIILVPLDYTRTQPTGATLIYVEDPYTAFSVLLEKFNVPNYLLKTGTEQPSFCDKSVEVPDEIYLGAFSYVSEGVVLGKGVKIYPHVFIGERVRIGDGCVLYSGVKVYENCVLGRQVIIHSGTVIGADGFGFAPQEDGSYKKIIQSGNVVIEDFVEIGANCTIDRATVGSTFIRSGVKLDNLIQIAHNVEIGSNTVIAAQTGISGSTTLGSNCLIGGQVGIIGHIKLASGTQVGAQSGVGKTVNAEKKKLRGSPAQGYQDALRAEVIYQHLPDLEKRVTRLEKELPPVKL